MRSQQRLAGSVTVTELELRKKLPTQGVNSGSAIGIPLLKKTFVFTSANWVADGALWYVDCQHNFRTRDVLYRIVDNDTSEEIMAERSNSAPAGDEDVLRLWLSYTPNCTVTVI